MIIRPVTLLLSALALTGCAAPISGIPAGESTTVSQPPSQGSTVSQPPSPRPRELSLDRLDLCTVLSSEQLIRLGVGKGSPGTATSLKDGREFPSCQWSRFPQEPQDQYLIGGDTTRGVRYPPPGSPGIDIVDVAGFMAIEFEDSFAEHDRNCDLTVDVAAGQNLFVRYDYDGATVPMTRKLACDKARAVAELAIHTLTERAGG
jgi:Protein of unknown function (DUF3558).